MSKTRKDEPVERDRREVDRQDELDRQRAVVEAVAAIEWPTFNPDGTVVIAPEPTRE